MEEAKRQSKPGTPKNLVKAQGRVNLPADLNLPWWLLPASLTV